jgi:hypothetical protein
MSLCGGPEVSELALTGCGCVHAKGHGKSVKAPPAVGQTLAGGSQWFYRSLVPKCKGPGAPGMRQV